MQSRIILISGKQGSGKSTASRHLRKWAMQHKLIPSEIKFADPLYALHAACLPVLKSFGLRPEDMEKDGELLQVLGTEYGRNRLGNDVWVNVARRCVDKWLAIDTNNICIIDDMRFENEFDAFPDAVRIRLEASEEMRKQRCSYWREDTKHQSEIGLDVYANRGKFSGPRACFISTEYTRPEITAEIIWKGFLNGFLF